MQYGPYGNQLKGQQFSTKIDGNEVIKEVIIRHGKCINAIGLVSASALSAFGGTLINNESKVGYLLYILLFTYSHTNI